MSNARLVRSMHEGALNNMACYLAIPAANLIKVPKVLMKYGGWLRNPAPVDGWFIIYPIIDRGSTIQGGAGSLPSIVIM